MSGGETGIRTLGTLSRLTVFKSVNWGLILKYGTLFGRLTYTVYAFYTDDTPSMFHNLFHETTLKQPFATRRSLKTGLRPRPSRFESCATTRLTWFFSA